MNFESRIALLILILNTNFDYFNKWENMINISILLMWFRIYINVYDSECIYVYYKHNEHSATHLYIHRIGKYIISSAYFSLD